MKAPFVRTFFAIALPMDCIKAIEGYRSKLKVLLEEQWKAKCFRWVKAENLHITLQFLAQVKEEDLSKILEQVTLELKQQAPIALHLSSLQWFPNLERPRILSLTIEPQQRLAELSAAIGKGILSSAYSIEARDFRGHLTLARVQGVEKPDLALLTASLPDIQVSEIILFRSELQKGGSVYTSIGSIELGHCRGDLRSP